jgi:arginyl-tRNA synthetase
MNIQSIIKDIIEKALGSLGVPKDMAPIILDHPPEERHGEYSTNIAMVLFKTLGASSKSPFELAQNIAEKIQAELKDQKNSYIENVKAMEPGFVNFHLNKKFFMDSVAEILEKKMWYGKTSDQWRKKAIIEYTDPNAFKQFHIGHLMSNAIGESLSRIFEFQDAKMTRAVYGSDVGRNVAMCIWGIKQLKHEFPADADLSTQVAFIGKAYVLGAQAHEENPQAKTEIQELNRIIYERSNVEVNKIYDWGKEVSEKHFNEMFKKLGTRFDYTFWESQVADEGKMIVLAHQEKGIFIESEGAIIFPGEKFGLHNRVFINSQGLPTYEAKELGLTKKKFELDDFIESIVITANEQTDYFKVVLKALEQMYPEIAHRTRHISHGMMRFATGKMSSRKGNIITGESLIADAEEMILEKIKERKFTDAEKKEVAEKVAIGAIKYSVLRQSIGKDIIFDEEKSLSFEGDSGPYLQYAYVRAKSVLAKAEKEGIKPMPERKISAEVSHMEKLLYMFPEIVSRAALEYAPNYIATYLILLAAEFNSFYNRIIIIDKKDPESPYKVALTEAVSWVMRNGLHLLGIEAPERM